MSKLLQKPVQTRKHIKNHKPTHMLSMTNTSKKQKNTKNKTEIIVVVRDVSYVIERVILPKNCYKQTK